MATYINRLYATGGDEAEERSGSFTRTHRTLPIQKSHVRRRLRPWHVIMLLGLQAAAFLGVRQLYLFTVGWNELDIRTVQVECAKPALKTALETYFTAARPGNILLADLDAIRAKVRRMGWVKDVKVTKVFPATLRLEVVEKTPFAVLDFNGLKLVDEGGLTMETVYSPDEYKLPVISDPDARFADFQEKWRGVRACLEALPAAEKARLAGITCAGFGTLALTFRDDPTRVMVDASDAAGQLAFFRSREARWQKDYGPLEYADVRLGDRAFLMKAADPTGDDQESTKETE